MILTLEQIEERVMSCGGTHIKRNNLRKRLKKENNEECNKNIERLRSEVRSLKAAGEKEKGLKDHYKRIGYFQRLKL